MSSIGFIGSGNMAEALIKGLLMSKMYSKRDVLLSDINEERLSYISSTYGVRTTTNNNELAKNCDLVVFAVKPNILPAVLKEIKKEISIKKLYISIAAGVKSSLIQDSVDKQIKVVRVMPNTPSLVLEGVSALYFDNSCTDVDKQLVESIFSSVGKAYELDNEKLMDAVTGLSGSGPAFVSIFIEALSDAGVKMGLSRDLSSKLAAQTVFGTSKMIMDSGKHPAEVKDMVSSPGGTTINGIASLEKNGFRNATISGVEAATLRSIELSKED